MAKMIIKHKVADFDTWKKEYDAHGDKRAASGITSGEVLQEDGDSNSIAIIFDVNDLDKAKAFTSSPELKEAMQKAGVQGPPEAVWFFS